MHIPSFSKEKLSRVIFGQGTPFESKPDIEMESLPRSLLDTGVDAETRAISPTEAIGAIGENDTILPQQSRATDIDGNAVNVELAANRPLVENNGTQESPDSVPPVDNSNHAWSPMDTDLDANVHSDSVPLKSEIPDHQEEATTSGNNQKIPGTKQTFNFRSSSTGNDPSVAGEYKGSSSSGVAHDQDEATSQRPPKRKRQLEAYTKPPHRQYDWVSITSSGHIHSPDCDWHRFIA